MRAGTDDDDDDDDDTYLQMIIIPTYLLYVQYSTVYDAL